MATARSWDSYKKTLLIVLKEINPRKIFEYGPGVSTKLMAAHPSTEYILTVEHDEAWYWKWRKEFTGKIRIVHIHDLAMYPFYAKETRDRYDFVFIDGKERHICLDVAQDVVTKKGVVMLHDAEREHYQNAIKRYKHVIFTDNGNTATMTNSDETFNKLEAIL